MKPGVETSGLPRGFLGSCRKHGIPEGVARKIAETFREEWSYYPRTYGEALVRGCE
ncbi:MAG: hypothetical protein ACP5UZ_08150 [Thermoplasmata archaeon]